MLTGRQEQLAAIREVLAGAAAQRAGVLRLVGGPGLGKTTLLDVADAEAADRAMHVVRLVALELEQDLPAAGLDILMRRLGAAGDPHTPGGLLTALGRASTDHPLLLLIDDVQWLDDQSMSAVSFATRRLVADPVAVILAGRPETDHFPALAAMRRLEVPPLSVAESVRMLGEVVPAMPRRTADAVAQALGGVPLALRDVVHLLPADVLAGRAPLPAPLPVSAAVQARYGAGFEGLSDAARMAVVAVACESVGDAEVLHGALELLDIPPACLESAEASGLIRLIPQPTFVHPLARAAAHSAARPDEVRRAHDALARTLIGRGDRTGALGHRAGSTLPPDQGLSDELADRAEHLAANPATRSEAATTALVAARFAATAQRRTAPLLAAAQCSDAEAATGIVRDLEGGPLTPDQRALCTFLRLERDITVDARAGLALLDGLFGWPLSDAIASQAEVWRVWQAADCLDLDTIRAVASRITATCDDSQDWVLLAAGGLGWSFLGENRRAVELLRRACALTRQVDPAALGANQLTDWAVLPGWLGEDDAEHAERFRTMDRLLRASGLPQEAATAAFFSAERALREGAWGRAEALFGENLELESAGGVEAHVTLARLAWMAACRGQVTKASALLASCREGLRASSPWLAHWAEASAGVLALTLGRIDQAVAALIPFRDVTFLGRGARDAIALGLADLVESLVALGEHDQARTVAEDLAGRLDGLVDPLAPALIARSRALAGDRGADDLFAEAIAHLARTTDAFQTARTHLYLGEHLRRTRRPREARDPLSSALHLFAQIDAEPWAERARRELAAAGGRTAPEPARPAAGLTTQEARVALAVSDGLTNAEVAQQLFLSIKTVEFHLSRVYRKLDVRSRGGLAKALASQNL